MDARAVRLATSPRVEKALVRRDVRALVRIADDNVNVAFVAGRVVVGEAERPSLVRAVDVVVAGERVGQVRVFVPLGGTLVRRLGREAGLEPGDLLLAVAGGEIIAGSQAVDGRIDLAGAARGDVRLAGSAYRALATPVSRAEPGTHLVALRPSAKIEAAAAGERRRVGLAGLALVAAVVLVAYAFAPAVARGRLALQQRALAARVLDNVGDGVFVVGSNGSAAFWNPAAEAMTGIGATSVVGRPFADVIPEWKTVVERIPVARGPLEPRRRVRTETVPVEIGGSELWLSMAGVEFPEGTVYTFRDVTEERRLEEAKTDFIATASHELRTPVASVYGAAMTLRRPGLGVDPGLRDQLLTTISEQSERLAHIVDEILLASQLSTGSLRFADERFEPTSVAREVVDAARLRLRPGLALELEAPVSPPAVRADRGKAQQVLANLVDNAIKYSPDGGRIRVAIEDRGHVVRFAVRDEGLGIPPGEHERIFEKFYRLDPNLTRGAGGTGLGLYITRELVWRMKGTISVESTPGVGSTFRFDLPAATGEGEQG